ncbi:MAG TPA: hypothetical protein VIQ54_01665 [Polyangia bacterium]|jgi:hypothetical protein
MTRWSRGTAFVLLLAAFGCSSTSASPDAATDTGMDSTGGFPGFGQACLPIQQQGDQVCADGLTCISVGAEQGRNLCSKICTTADAPCTGAPAGTTPTCGREWQVGPTGLARVCEFFCDQAAPNCPAGTTCLPDFDGITICQPPIR